RRWRKCSRASTCTRPGSKRVSSWNRSGPTTTTSAVPLITGRSPPRGRGTSMPAPIAPARSRPPTWGNSTWCWPWTAATNVICVAWRHRRPWTTSTCTCHSSASTTRGTCPTRTTATPKASLPSTNCWTGPRERWSTGCRNCWPAVMAEPPQRIAPQAEKFGTRDDIAAFLRTLPLKPGVYRMLADNGDVLYVGKAGALKRRVGSYFSRPRLDPRLASMIGQIARIEVTVTRTEGEALLLENQLIKSLKPRYNIQLRDDKSHPYIHLSADAFPRIGFHRGSRRAPGRYFGPY